MVIESFTVPAWCLAIAGVVAVQMLVGLTIRQLPKDEYGDVLGQCPPFILWAFWWLILPVTVTVFALWFTAWVLSLGAVRPPWSL